MLFFNFIGVAFSAAGLVVGCGLWFLFGQWFGDSFRAIAGGLMLGSLFTAFLDLRYRWLGQLESEPPTPKPADSADPKGTPVKSDPAGEETLAGQVTSASLSLAHRLWNIIWPFSGGHILWIPVWVPAAFFFAAYFLGYLSFIFPSATK